MRFFSILVGLTLAWYGYNQFVKKPADSRAKAQRDAQAQAQAQLQAQAPTPPQAQPPQVFDEEQLAKVRTSINDSDPKVRWQAAEFLLNARDPQAEGFVIHMAQADDEAANRRQALMTLASRGDKRFTPNLISALRDIEVDVRLAALSALGRMGDFSAASAIGDALRDSDDRVRLAAIQTLNELQNKHNQELRRIEEERKRYEQQLAEHRRKMEQLGRKD